MFYLMMHSTHFIYGYMVSDIHMVKDHSDSERGNPLPPHRLLFLISSKGSFICIIPRTTVFVTPVMEHWLERSIIQWIHMGYSFRLVARFFLYASSHGQDNTYHCLCYTSRGALSGTIAQWVHHEGSNWTNHISLPSVA